METETRSQVTNKFAVGVGLIIFSLVLGKLVLVPLLLFPGETSWRFWMVIVWGASWPILFAGIGLAGWEGYRLVNHRYKSIKRTTVHNVRREGRKAVRHTRWAAGHAVERVKSDIRNSERTFKQVKRKGLRGL